MKSIRLSLLLVLFGSIALEITQGALPSRSDTDLDKGADVILVATILDATTSEEGKGDWVNTIHTLTIQVVAIDKGGPLWKSDPGTVRCWTIQTRPKGWAGPSGHYGVPEKGDRVRFWLTKGSEGSWSPLAPNGIRIVEPEGISVGSQ